MTKTYELHHIKDQSWTKNNVYIIADKKTKKAAIVDPACSLNQINDVIKSHALTVETILLTHTHPDHIRSVDSLVNQHNCKFYVSRKEANFYSYHCKNIQLFDDGDLIHLGHTPIKCILTPGHTSGSACFLLENSLFTGDTIFMEGCGLCTAPGGSAVDMFHSIAKIKHQVPDSVLVYSGHTYNEESGQSLAYLKKNNIYFNIPDKESFVEFRMRKKQTNLFTFK